MKFLHKKFIPPQRPLSPGNIAIQREFRAIRQALDKGKVQEDMALESDLRKLPPGRPNHFNAVNKLRKLVMDHVEAQGMPLRVYTRTRNKHLVLFIERKKTGKRKRRVA